MASLGLLTGVIGDRFGHIECEIFAALATSALDRLAVARRVRVAARHGGQALIGHVVGNHVAYSAMAFATSNVEALPPIS